MQHAHAFKPTHRTDDSTRKTQRSFPVRRQGDPAEYSAGLVYAIKRDWIKMHESGTFMRLNQAGADRFV
ncbi:MAG: hypothetical protein C0480_00640 [Bradyrhizobium sp.]|nr:hypothetical protein [Bradyrhizobium sp.]